MHNFPMALCHGPPAYFSLHLPHMYWEQGAVAISTFLLSFRSSSPMAHSCLHVLNKLNWRWDLELLLGIGL